MSGDNGVEPAAVGIGSGSLSKRPGVRQDRTSIDRRRSEKVTGLRSRKNSLRRAKDSTDMLRERSTQGQNGKESTLDGNSAARDVKGTKFTVSNVGNNGKIYLRLVPISATLISLERIRESCTHCSSRPAPKIHPRQVSPIPPVPPSPTKPIGRPPNPPSLPQPALQTRESVWTLLSTPLRAPNQANTPPSDYFELRTRPKRSQSQSTVDTQLANERLESGAFKIVIDRPDSAPKEEGSKLSFPAIEVPIPHYRLGTPTFSARGTAFFHHSVYTRSSAYIDGDSSVLTPGEFEQMFPKPPGIEAHAVISRRHSHTSPQSFAYSVQSNGRGSAIAQHRPSHLYQAQKPIGVEIFESLARNPNDPAIVKYSTINGDIIAATPARIISQITSEKFLDYELLSDFFLTVRSYLSTHDLLAYLLARFEWAVNRFDDRGRIIRVRTFAALRHWILNYFSYDFVTDRDLRVHFCHRLNELTRLIKSRNYGAADMKLISDLKRCWNGRCLVYWDSPVAVDDSQQDVDIQPGGILGSRDSRLVHQSQLHSTVSLPPALTVNPAQVTAGATSISTWYSVVMDNGEADGLGQNRQSSVGTAGSLPISPTSEQSQPVLSCSIPAKGLKKALPYANKTIGIHPVPHDTDGRRICPAAPSSLSNEPARPTGGHRRSGSFSDAARDKRAPLSTDVPTSSAAIAQELYQGNSMLRGAVVPPGLPFVSVVPTTPVSELPRLLSLASSTQGSEGSSNRKLIAQKNTPNKSIIGNIRRALSSKNTGVSSQSAGAGIASTPALSMGKSATLPLNVVYHPSNNGQIEASRSHSRVDLLAATVYDAFQKVTLSSAELTQNIGVALGTGPSQPSESSRWQSLAAPESSKYLMPEPLRPELSRLTSGVTDSSQSIVIMDDTGLNIPHMTGFRTPREPLDTQTRHEEGQVVPNLQAHVNGRHHTQMERSETSRVPSKDRQQGPGESGVIAELETRPISLAGIMPPSRPSIITRNASTRTTSMSLRRYASFQSTLEKHAPGNSVQTHARSDSSRSIAKEAPARMLRRRPGGDLRANQNVHDMEGPPRPKSAGSVTTCSESVRNSRSFGFGERIARTFITVRKSPEYAIYDLGPNIGSRRDDIPSYVRTHSSQNQNRRPSFEAAVAEFARIPDDEEGGIEATLLKLEGRYKSPVQSPVPQVSDQGSNSSHNERLDFTSEPKTPEEQIHVEEVAVDSSSSASSVRQERANALEQDPLPLDDQRVSAIPAVPRETVISTVYAESEDSYNSVPILARGGEDKSPSLDKGKEKVSKESGEIRIQVANDKKKLKRGSVAPSATTDSFLLDENDEFLSDVESEASVETVDANVRTDNWLSGTHQPEEQSHKENTVLIGQSHPPSPPMTMENALSISSQAKQAHDQRKPPTPDPSPVSQHVEPNVFGSKPADAVEAKHLPFILGFDSELLAQQFTILEKEALKEVDWQDLVELRWQNTTASPTNWVNYLMSQDSLGIDLVTARFNIMVKWALSEIVMTESIQERALTIMKYIHVAHQARKIHNYATLFQLTIALTSCDCTRLSKTWDIVPTAEKEILQDLEMLVSPRRNFQNLRMEMEKANADEGCIPVIGMFSLCTVIDELLTWCLQLCTYTTLLTMPRNHHSFLL